MSERREHINAGTNICGTCRMPWDVAHADLAALTEYCDGLERENRELSAELETLRSNILDLMTGAYDLVPKQRTKVLTDTGGGFTYDINHDPRD